MAESDEVVLMDVEESDGEDENGPDVLVYNSETCEISKFLEEFPPSSTPGSRYEWIAVHNDNKTAEWEVSLAVDEAAIHREWTSFKRPPTQRDVDGIARRFKCLTGKWMLFRYPDAVDEVWARIARAVLDGKLGPCAKVSGLEYDDEGKPKEHVICVYSQDYLDREATFRVRETLLECCGIEEKIRYKPDISTILGIYRGTHPGLRPTRYLG